MGYKGISLIQSFVLFICGWSVFEAGTTNLNPLDDSIFPILNDILFSDGGSQYWNPLTFWGYCIIIVAILQFIKAIQSDSY